MRENEILDEAMQDATDRCIMQALTDGLSDITVSGELFERTLSAAKKREGMKKERMRSRRVWGGLFTAAAAVLVVVLGFGVMRSGMKEGSDADGEIPSGSTLDGIENTQQSASSIKGGNDNSFGEGMAPDSFDGCGTAAVGNAPCDSAGGEADAWEDGSGSIMEEPEQMPVEEWLCGELLAEFDADGGEEMPPQEGAGADTGDVDGRTRSISWVRGDKEIFCVIHADDRRIVATLREGESLRRLELRDWVYADRLWELAGE